MSHYSVLVVGSDVAAALAPFDENDRSTLTPVDEAKLRADFAEYGEKGQPLEAYAYAEGYRLHEGKWCTTYNHRSKWDWYVPGGRWPDRLITKDGKRCNSARVGDLDFDAMRADGVKRAEGWWTESLLPENLSSRAFIFNIKPGTTREEYIEKCSRFSAFAVVKGGEWFEKGRMGWWGTVANEKDQDEWDQQFDALLHSLGPDEVITLVDCHI